MTNNTALSAKNGQFQSAEQIAENVTSRDEEHKRFFLPYLTKCRYGDVYHAVLVLWQRIALQFLENTETRKNIKAICDFKSGRVKAECKGNLMIALHDGWITSRSAKVVSMAFNFCNNGTPSVYDYDDAEEQLTECGSIRWRTYSAVGMQIQQVGLILLAGSKSPLSGILL